MNENKGTSGGTSANGGSSDLQEFLELVMVVAEAIVNELIGLGAQALVWAQGNPARQTLLILGAVGALGALGWAGDCNGHRALVRDCDAGRASACAILSGRR